MIWVKRMGLESCIQRLIQVLKHAQGLSQGFFLTSILFPDENFYKNINFMIRFKDLRDLNHAYMSFLILIKNFLIWIILR